MANTIVGTPHYLSPEMCDNKPYGKKSDVWALGCILCELCTLSKAFESSSISKIILMIMSGQFTRLPDCYSPQLRQLVDQLLSVKTEGRPYVDEILQQPFVRGHLDSYLEWCKDIPGAQSTAACLMAIESAKRLSSMGIAGDTAGQRSSVDGQQQAADRRGAAQQARGNVPATGGAATSAAAVLRQRQPQQQQQQAASTALTQQPASGRRGNVGSGQQQQEEQQQQQQQQHGPRRSASGVQLLLAEQLTGLERLQQLKASLKLSAGFGGKVLTAPASAARRTLHA